MQRLAPVYTQDNTVSITQDKTCLYLHSTKNLRQVQKCKTPTEVASSQGGLVHTTPGLHGVMSHGVATRVCRAMAQMLLACNNLQQQRGGFYQHENTNKETTTTKKETKTKETNAFQKQVQINVYEGNGCLQI